MLNIFKIQYLNIKQLEYYKLIIIKFRKDKSLKGK